jgi:adenine phosphoribosyltransferase
VVREDGASMVWRNREGVTGVSMSVGYNLDAAIRRIPDFPKPGILFYDITSVLMNPEAFGFCVQAMIDRYRDRPIDSIIAVESRGFVFAAPLARELKVPLVLARKRGKLPGPTYSKTYALEYGTDTIEVHQADLKKNDRVLVVDDLVASGGTLKATAELVDEVGGTVLEMWSVIGLPFLGYVRKLAPIHVETLVEFQSE